MDREGGQGWQKRPRSKKTQPSQKPNHVLSSDEGDSMSPSRSTPPKTKSKTKKRPRSSSPSMLEDIIDGFAIQSFRTQDDLEVTIFICQSVAIFRLLPVATSFDNDKAWTDFTVFRASISTLMFLQITLYVPRVLPSYSQDFMNAVDFKISMWKVSMIN